MPKQVSRLLILFVIFIALFLTARHFLVPESFGKYGHYRGDALEDNKKFEAKYVENSKCLECHNEIDTLKAAGLHRLIRCQTCHGPGYKHIEDPSANKMIKQTDRAFCGKCHSKNAGRNGKNIKQQDITTHNPEGKCVECHNPHQPWKM